MRSLSSALLFAAGCVTTTNAQTIFLNELHYDNDGTDTGEFFEVAGPAGTDLLGYRTILYNGNGGAPYSTVELTGTIPDQGNGFGVLSFLEGGIQNGAPDGLCLVDSTDVVVQFLSYEGSFSATGGVCDGLTSTNIGVDESSSTPIGESLQLTGSGTTYGDFSWTGPAAESPGTVNGGQSFGGTTGPATNIVINEVDADQVSTDSQEFIELYDGGAGNTPLGGLVLVLYNGNGDAVYDAIDLTGYTTRPNGYFVVGSANVENVDLAEFTTNGLQNGADAVALYIGDIADFSSGSALTTTNLIDAIVYDTNDADDVGLLPLINAGQPQVDEGSNGDATGHSLQRIPNGGGGQRNTDSFVALPPTPGSENIVPPTQTVTIPEIQGAHRRGFQRLYLQDPAGDDDMATSDAIFVFTGSSPSVSIRDKLEVTGTVSEFTPGGNNSRNLSTTQISGNPSFTIKSSGNPLPDPVIIGASGRVPPAQNIDDDAFGDFDPVSDGIDFFESLEGMLVKAEDVVAVAGTNRFGEIFVVAKGSGASGISTRGTLNISPNDFNPEKIQIDEDTGILSDFSIPEVDTGAELGDVTGVVSYGFGNFEILPTMPFDVVSGGSLSAESTMLVGEDGKLTVASYNVLNLDPNDSDGDADIANGRFDAIAKHIVDNLNSPDVIALQEVQDNSGSGNDGTVAADETLRTLTDAIEAAGGPTYHFVDNTYIGNNLSGGQPGGNIRTAFLFNPNRVSLNAAVPVGDQSSGSSFEGARLPLAATFQFDCEEITIVNNHFSSKGGSAPIFGVEQDFASRQEDPSVNGSLDERREQAQAVNTFVDSLIASDPVANVIVLGDLNEFEFVSPLDILKGTVVSVNGGQGTALGGSPILTNLIDDIPDNERYSFIFQGNSQQLDHILVSDGLAASEIDIVHVNSEFVESDQRASDHDPIVARFTFECDTNQCTTNSECRRDGLGFSCLEGTCVGCNNDSQCRRFGEGTIACNENNECVSECNQNSQCRLAGLGFSCLEGACVGCNNDSQCRRFGEGTIACNENNECVSQCTRNSQCRLAGLGSSCQDGSCV